MPASEHIRPISATERAELERALRVAPTRIQLSRRALGEAVVLWAACSLLLAVVWIAGVRLVVQGSSIQRILHTYETRVFLAYTTPVVAVLALLYSWRRLSAWPDRRPRLVEDLAAGQVLEEHYHFAEAMRFQEPEHGGLMYALRSSTDRPYIVFDLESQDRGVQGQDPLASSFAPRAELVVVRAPKARYVLSQEFTGALLDAGPPKELEASPSQWPEQDEYSPLRWQALESSLVTKGPRAAPRDDA